MRKQRLLLLTPPLLQTNTPYPATMHLTGFLGSKGFDVHQRDLSIKVVRDILLEYGDETTEELLEFLGGPVPLEAKREASKAIDELAIWIRDNIDPEFGLFAITLRTDCPFLTQGERTLFIFSNVFASGWTPSRLLWRVPT